MIGVIVLAAGASSRFGGHKLLAPLGGEPLVRRTVERVLASAADPVVVVLGRDPERVRDTLGDLPIRTVVNPRYAEGMSTSLGAGIRALDSSAEAAIIVLGDQPGIAPEVIDRLISTHRDTGKPIVLPSYRGERGHPVLFAASLFTEIGAIRGDRGAREVIDRDPERVAEVAFDLLLPRDVDTPEDLRALEREFAGRGATQPAPVPSSPPPAAGKSAAAAAPQEE